MKFTVRIPGADAPEPTDSQQVSAREEGEGAEAAAEGGVRKPLLHFPPAPASAGQPSEDASHGSNASPVTSASRAAGEGSQARGAMRRLSIPATAEASGGEGVRDSVLHREVVEASSDAPGSASSSSSVARPGEAASPGDEGGETRGESAGKATVAKEATSAPTPTSGSSKREKFTLAAFEEDELAEDEAYNPLLDDEEEAVEVTAKPAVEATSAAASAARVASPPEVSSPGTDEIHRATPAEGAASDEWNPLLDTEDEEDYTTASVGVPTGGEHASESDASAPPGSAAVPPSGEPVVVRIPSPPKPSSKDEENRARKEERAAAREAAHRAKVTASAPAPTPFKPKTTYEVAVERDGREKGRGPRVEAPAQESPAEAPGATYRIVSSDGEEKWVARRAPAVSKGRLAEDELKIFTNLNRKKRDVLHDVELRDVFSRSASTPESPAEKKKRERLLNRAIFGDEQLQAGSKKRFTEKDRDVLRFIGMFKYANARHIARILSVKEATMVKRLNELAQRGLVEKKELYGARPLWYLTEGGVVCSGLEVPRVRNSGITYTMLPHQFVVNHTAGHLWGGGVNVLNLEDFPGRYRRNEAGEAVLGETLVSELAIQSAFAQIKRDHKAETYRPIITGERDKQFRAWTNAGGASFGPSPEQLPGNEYMWTIIPPQSLRLAYHVPDLVVARPRGADGKPKSIAVEVELANKPLASYERVLNAYRFDSLLYGQVIWVVKSRGAARKLEEAARKLGLWDDERVDIVPILTEDGVFKNKAEWTL